MIGQKNIFTTIFVAGLSFITLSQSPDSLRPKRIIVTTSVFEYIPTIKLNTGNFNIGTDIYLSRRKSIYFNCGYIKSFSPAQGLLSISSLNTQGIKMQVEGRHYFRRHKMVQPAILLFWFHIFQYNTQTLSNTGYYTALHTSFQRTATDRQETVVDFINNNPFPNTTHTKLNIYTVNRNAYSVNIKFGYQCIKKCGLTVDYSVGLGAAFISSNSKNRLGSDTDWPHSEQDFPMTKLFDKGTCFYPNVLYQLRLGWGL
ncbi:MAG: DUF3575 domain-containing protein [Bacteroidetes bacterium]|nr:DUF3575 domain-containing protein [Bacteroidota bacterium]